MLLGPESLGEDRRSIELAAVATDAHVMIQRFVVDRLKRRAADFRGTPEDRIAARRGRWSGSGEGSRGDEGLVRGT